MSEKNSGMKTKSWPKLLDQNNLSIIKNRDKAFFVSTAEESIQFY